MTLPAKSATPGMAGNFGWDRNPLAGLRQKPSGGDEVPGGKLFTTGNRDPPDAGLLVPAGALDGRIEPHVPAHVELVGDVVGVSLDFGAGREQPRPVRVRLEKIGVGGGRDVDGKARVAIHVPGPVEVVLAVENHEILVTRPLELDGCAYPAETGPHDDRVELLRSHAQTVPQVPETLVTGSAFERSRPRGVKGGDAGHRPVTLSPCFGRRIQHVQLHRVVGY